MSLAMPVAPRLAPDGVSIALDALVGRFVDTVRRVGWRHGLSSMDVDEVVQDVRIRLWRACAHGDASGATIAALSRSYVYRTAMSAALDMLRRRRSRAETTLEPERTGETAVALVAPPDGRVERRELSAQVALAVEQIPESRRAVVRMYLAGYGREEIARLMGWTEAKTRNLLYRGLGDLRARLTAMGIGPEAAP